MKQNLLAFLVLSVLLLGCDINSSSSPGGLIGDDINFAVYSFSTENEEGQYSIDFADAEMESGLRIVFFSFDGTTSPSSRSYQVQSIDENLEFWDRVDSGENESIFDGFVVARLILEDKDYIGYSGSIEYSSTRIELSNVLFIEKDSEEWAYVEGGSEHTYSGSINFADMTDMSDM